MDGSDVLAITDARRTPAESGFPPKHNPSSLNIGVKNRSTHTLKLLFCQGDHHGNGALPLEWKQRQQGWDGFC